MSDDLAEYRKPLDWSSCPEVIRIAGKYADVLGIYYGAEYYKFIESPEFPIELAKEANVYFWKNFHEIDKFTYEHSSTNKDDEFKDHSWRCSMTIHMLALANDFKKFDT